MTWELGIPDTSLSVETSMSIETQFGMRLLRAVL